MSGKEPSAEDHARQLREMQGAADFSTMRNVLGDQSVQPSLRTLQLMHSIVQEFGHIPSEYFEAAGQGLYHRRQGAAREDGYRGDYGIEDTRQAVLEARSQGVNPFGIAIDDQAQDYLPHMFGRASYTVAETCPNCPIASRTSTDA